jgi:predicted secreted protein
MKNTIYTIGIIAIAVTMTAAVLGVATFLTPEQPTQKSFTIADTGKSINVKVGETFTLTLKNYGDGGYLWVMQDYDENILGINGPVTSGSSGMLGDFGNDVWTITALTKGTVTLEMSSVRPWETSEIVETMLFIDDETAPVGEVTITSELTDAELIDAIEMVESDVAETFTITIVVA